MVARRTHLAGLLHVRYVVPKGAKRLHDGAGEVFVGVEPGHAGLRCFVFVHPAVDLDPVASHIRPGVGEVLGAQRRIGRAAARRRWHRADGPVRAPRPGYECARCTDHRRTRRGGSRCRGRRRRDRVRLPDSAPSRLGPRRCVHVRPWRQTTETPQPWFLGDLRCELEQISIPGDS